LRKAKLKLKSDVKRETKSGLVEVLKSIDKRFDSIDAQFKTIDKHFEGVEETLKSLEMKQFVLDNKFDYFKESSATRNDLKDVKISILYWIIPLILGLYGVIVFSIIVPKIL